MVHCANVLTDSIEITRSAVKIGIQISPLLLISIERVFL